MSPFPTFDLDYCRVERRLGPQPWIIPLREPLRRDPWTVPLVDWEQHVNCPTPARMIEPAKNSLEKDHTP